jgi:hypothetical protein
MEQYLYDTNSFEIVGEGNFSFALLHESLIIGGFTIPIENLSKATTWFPITSPFSDLESLPSTSEGARVKLSIKPTDLYTVQECSEYSIESSQSPLNLSKFRQELNLKDDLIKKLEKVIQDEKSENDRLQHIVDELAENFYKFQAEHKERVEDLLQENQEILEKQTKTSEENRKLSAEVLILKKTIENLQLRSSQNVFSQMDFGETENFNVRLRESEGKRKELQQILNSANNKWLDTKTTNNTLIYLEKENKSLINKVKTLTDQLNEPRSIPLEDENFMKYMHSLSSKLMKTKEKNRELKEQLEAYDLENNSYKEIVEKFRGEASKQASENSELSEQLRLALSKIPHREEKVDQIDKELKQYFKDKQMKNPFVKISEGVYNYGNKRLCFNLKNGMPVIRVGGGYMFIDEFLKMYHTHCNKKKEEFPLRSYSLEGKGGNTLRVKQKSENDEGRLNDTDSPSLRHEIKVLKKVPRRVFIP